MQAGQPVPVASIAHPMATYSIKPETLATISEAETVYAAILKSERSGRDTPEYRQQKDLYQRLVNNLRTQSITSIEGAVLTSDGTQVMSMNSLKLVDKGLSIERCVSVMCLYYTSN